FRALVERERRGKAFFSSFSSATRGGNPFSTDRAAPRGAKSRFSRGFQPSAAREAVFRRSSGCTVAAKWLSRAGDRKKNRAGRKHLGTGADEGCVLADGPRGWTSQETCS